MTDHTNMVNGVIALLIGVIMTACNKQVLPQLPSSSPQNIQLTSTETQKPSPTVVASTIRPTFKPSITPSPSHTPTFPLPTNTQYIHAEATMTAQAYIQKSTQIASFPIQCTEARLDTTVLSPKGNWLAIHCGDHGGDQNLEVINHQGKRWIYKYKDFVGDDYSQGIGGLYPVYWSNEDYLYFTVYIGFDGGGPCFYGFGVQGLYRIDLKTGTSNAVLPTILDFGGGYLIRFSPDGARIAYDRNGITILNLKTGNKSKINVGKAAVGEFTWSPDGRKLAYSTCTWVPETLDTDKSKIQIYSLDENASRIIFETQGTMLGIKSLVGSPKFNIFEMDYAGIGGESDQFYDWNSNQLIQVTLTPTP